MPEQPHPSSSSISAPSMKEAPAPPYCARDVGVHQPHLPRLLDDRLGPRRIPVELPGDRADLLRGEVVRHLAQRVLLVAQ